MVAPAFWYVIAGLPGLFVAKTVNTLDSMIGHRSPRYLAFGRTSVRQAQLVSLLSPPVS